MQFLSAGKPSLREKTHAFDTGLQAADRSLPILAGVIDCLYRQAHALIVFERQPAGGLEDPSV
jgi:hypothetical protein